MDFEEKIAKAFERVSKGNHKLFGPAQYDKIYKGLLQSNEIYVQLPAEPKSKHGKSRAEYLAIARGLLGLNIRRHDAGAFFMRKDIHDGFRRNGIKKGIGTSLERFVDEKIDTVLSDIEMKRFHESRGNIRTYKAVARYVEINNQKYGLIFYSLKRE